jgi:uncharacterized RDD family membrane protein YckC
MRFGGFSLRDSSVGALTPEGIEFVLFPAGLPVRACAYAIDKLLQWLILVIIWSAASLRSGMWLMLILNFCVDWFYHVFFEMIFRGQSPGKRIMGIRVTRSDGAPVDGASSVLRNLLRFADTFCFLCPIALISMAASPGFRRLGDWAGGTLVVYTPRALALSRQPPLAWLAEVEPVIPPPLSHEEQQAVLLFARRYPLLGAARANEIARAWARQLRAESAAPSERGFPPDAAYMLGIARTLSGGAHQGAAQ